MVLASVTAPTVQRVRLLAFTVTLIVSLLAAPSVHAAERIELPDGWTLCVGAGCPDNPMVSVSVGASMTCGVVDGQVWCWNGSTVWPVYAGKVRKVSVGFDHACALRGDATVTCWGSNSRGQLNVSTARNVKDVLAAHSTTCLLLRNGKVECVGWALGNGWGDAKTLEVMPAPRGKGFLSTGYAGVCLRTVRDGIWCHSGQDDALDITNGYGPVVTPIDCDPACGRVVFRPLAFGATSKGGSVGRYAGCLTGSLRCWNSSLGVLKPVAKGLRGVTSVGVTDDRGCAVASGKVHCWVGSGRPELVQVVSSHLFKQVEVDWQSAALARDGDLWVWPHGGSPVQWTFLR